MSRGVMIGFVGVRFVYPGSVRVCGPLSNESVVAIRVAWWNVVAERIGAPAEESGGPVVSARGGNPPAVDVRAAGLRAMADNPSVVGRVRSRQRHLRRFPYSSARTESVAWPHQGRAVIR